jgi:hypothetical protein
MGSGRLDPRRLIDRDRGRASACAVQCSALQSIYFCHKFDQSPHKIGSTSQRCQRAPRAFHISLKLSRVCSPARPSRTTKLLHLLPHHNPGGRGFAIPSSLLLSETRRRNRKAQIIERDKARFSRALLSSSPHNIKTHHTHRPFSMNDVFPMMQQAKSPRPCGLFFRLACKIQNATLLPPQTCERRLSLFPLSPVGTLSQNSAFDPPKKRHKLLIFLCRNPQTLPPSTFNRWKTGTLDNGAALTCSSSSTREREREREGSADSFSFRSPKRTKHLAADRCTMATSSSERGEKRPRPSSFRLRPNIKKKMVGDAITQSTRLRRLRPLASNTFDCGYMEPGGDINDHWSLSLICKRTNASTDLPLGNRATS